MAFGKKANSSRLRLHYIATDVTVLQDMPWLLVKEHKRNQLKYSWDVAVEECEKLLNPKCSTFAAAELVYGRAG